MLKNLVGLSAVCLSISCSPPASENSPAPLNESQIAETESPVVPASAVVSPQDFANTVAASDAFEIEISKLAQERSKSASVKDFAGQMIKAHTQSTAELKAAGGKASPAIVADTTLPPDLVAKIDLLKNASEASFDRTFAETQVAAHQAALDALRLYEKDGSDAALKGFAGKAVPVVEGHLAMARKL